ncbi:MAG: type II toxin-antitoxin system VapC family toxin [Alphaproteobacteria bacterium]|nr:type II toxin-antitoxin system VapC family toxin [Alphaproteobacteria bacterium]MDE2341200.1 type II toxin-antitoxin system VapC family toxin [Alphaproteobacteria bacterium]
MIVDTSALVAIVRRESEFEAIFEALLSTSALLPAPARVELDRVVGKTAHERHLTDVLIGELESSGLQIIPFGDHHASIARDANTRFGQGNGKGGALNLLDLMVYAVAQERGLPILCTGKDFAATDAVIHPASRVG